MTSDCALVSEPDKPLFSSVLQVSERQDVPVHISKACAVGRPLAYLDGNRACCRKLVNDSG